MLLSEAPQMDWDAEGTARNRKEQVLLPGLCHRSTVGPAEESHTEPPERTHRGHTETPQRPHIHLYRETPQRPHHTETSNTEDTVVLYLAYICVKISHHIFANTPSVLFSILHRHFHLLDNLRSCLTAWMLCSLCSLHFSLGHFYYSAFQGADFSSFEVKSTDEPIEGILQLECHVFIYSISSDY